MTLRWSPSHTIPLIGLLSAFIILAAIYAWATPPLEASDELWHFGMVMQLAQTGDLPVQDANVETIWQQEGSQPPLYYAVIAVVIRLTGIPADFDAAIQPNPHAQAGQPANVGNKNLVLHPTPPETTRAVLLGRMTSILFSTITLIAVYLTTRVLAPHRIALLAAALTAFNPMFIFISASVNNDNLVTALNSLVIWQMFVFMRDGFSTRRSLLIAILVACASLTKLSGLVIVPVIALAALLTAYRRRDTKGIFILGAAMLVAWLGIAGWWFLRNVQLYGELFGTRTMAAVAGERLGGFDLATLLSEFEGFRIAFWGWFGAVNIIISPIFYVTMDVVTLIAVIGALVYWQQQPTQRVRLSLLLLTVMLAAGAVIAWTAQTYASQGRLLFPYLAAISPLLALGLSALLRRAALAVPTVMLVVAALVPFAVLQPAYASPIPLGALPTSASPIYARYGDVELVGYELSPRRFGPGDTIPVTVYWRVLQPTEQDLSLWLHAVAESEIGKVDSYPGGGTLRTSTWEPGLYADTYAIPIDGDSPRSNLRIQVGWQDNVTQTLVTPTDEDGNPLSSVMLDAGAFGAAETPGLPNDVRAVDDVLFGEAIALRGYQVEGDRLSLWWDALSPLPQDYTVFVQILDAANTVISQGDAPPTLPTSFWLAGERFVTHHTIVRSIGDRLIIGWYNPTDSARLQTNHPDNAYVLDASD